MLEALVWVRCSGETVADLVAFVAEAKRMGVEPATKLLDGLPAGVVVEGFDVPAPDEFTFGALERWVNGLSAAVSAVTVVRGASDVAVDMTAVRVEAAECSEHVGAAPAMVWVSLDERCAGHGT